MMEGWRKYQIGYLVLKSKLRNPKKESEKYFKYVDVSSVSRESYTITRYTITKGAEAPSRARKIIQTDDVIFATVRPTLMRISLVPPELNNEICSTGYCVLKPNKELINPAFLYYSILPEYFISKIDKLQRGASYPAIRDSDLKDQFINIPSLLEQRKIAYTLRTVQKAIKKQDQLIKTTTELKKTLMQKFFTEGLHGEPQKETEIGLVPESWKVVKIGDYLDKTKLKDPTKEPGHEFIYVDVSSVSNEFFRIDNVSKLLGKEAPSRARKLIQIGDVIFATVRPTLKRIAKIEEKFNNQVCSTGYCVLKPKYNELNQEFLYQYLQTDNLINRIEKLQRGASYPAVRDTDVKNMLIPFPKVTDQQRIGLALNVFDNKIELFDKKKQTFTSLFKTLLHELMTGQYRVHELEFEGMIKEYKQKEQPLSMAAED